MRHLSRVLCAATIALAGAAAAGAAQLVPPTPVQVTPDHLAWTPYPAGGVQAYLLGDPSQPGTYVVRIRLPAGLKLAPGFMDKLLAVRPEEWTGELAGVKAFFDKFGGRLPPELWRQHEALQKRLAAVLAR